jgi:hypothetical protein
VSPHHIPKFQISNYNPYQVSSCQAVTAGYFTVVTAGCFTVGKVFVRPEETVEKAPELREASKFEVGYTPLHTTKLNSIAWCTSSLHAKYYCQLCMSGVSRIVMTQSAMTAIPSYMRATRVESRMPPPPQPQPQPPTRRRHVATTKLVSSSRARKPFHPARLPNVFSRTSLTCRSSAGAEVKVRDYLTIPPLTNIFELKITQNPLTLP